MCFSRFRRTDWATPQPLAERAGQFVGIVALLPRQSSLHASRPPWKSSLAGQMGRPPGPRAVQLSRSGGQAAGRPAGRRFGQVSSWRLASWVSSPASWLASQPPRSTVFLIQMDPPQLGREDFILLSLYVVEITLSMKDRIHLHLSL